MLLPPDFSQITPLTSDLPDVLKGMNIIEFEEGNDEGGDYYCLYWPLGREQFEPYVCRFQHEEYILTVPYCRLADFLSDSAVDENDLRHESFFYYPYAQAKLALKKGQAEQAIEKLLTCVDFFPEFSNAWTLLAVAYQQCSRLSEATLAIRRALLSAWHFGVPSAQCLAIFQSMEIPAQLAQDPLFLNRTNLLSASTYQQAAKNDYCRLWNVVQHYTLLEDFESAVRLAQNYGYALQRESKSMQELLHFSTNRWLADFEAIKQHLSA